MSSLRAELGGVQLPVKMASRWRVWEGSAHVDAFVSNGDVNSMKYTPVHHTFDWKDLPALLNATQLHPKLKYQIYQDSFAMKSKMKGISESSTCSGKGRAEVLRMRLGVRIPDRSSSGLEFNLLQQKRKDDLFNGKSSKSVGSTSQLSNFHMNIKLDEQTLYFKNLPKNLPEQELQDTVMAFGKVSFCRIYHREKDSIGYVRLEEPGACEWVISYFQGMPYDNTSQPVECGYANYN